MNQRNMNMVVIKYFLLLAIQVVLVSAECKDNAIYATRCVSWKRFCHKGHWVSFMKKFCRATCGTCSKSTPPPTECRDKKTTSACTDWKERGYCNTDSRFVQFMKINCEKTCRFCKEAKSTFSLARDLKVKRITNCGFGNKSKGRVVDGVDALPNSWPWQVGIYIGNIFFCGGTLISEKYVITAAHCMKEKFRKFMSVRLGDHTRDLFDGTEQIIKVEDFVVHEGYNNRTTEHDIAIMKLKSSAKFDKSVGVACLPEKDEDLDLKRVCYITGWGKTDSRGESVNVLQEARLPLVSNEECRKKNIARIGSPKLTEAMLCAGFSDGRKVSGCHGDSGGPFVCRTSKNRWVLHGAVSWGSPKCDASHRYTVFTRVSKYIDWIYANMK